MYFNKKILSQNENLTGNMSENELLSDLEMLFNYKPKSDPATEGPVKKDPPKTAEKTAVPPKPAPPAAPERKARPIEVVYKDEPERPLPAKKLIDPAGAQVIAGLEGLGITDVTATAAMPPAKREDNEAVASKNNSEAARGKESLAQVMEFLGLVCECAGHKVNSLQVLQPRFERLEAHKLRELGGEVNAVYKKVKPYPVKRQKLFRHTAEISKVYLEIRNVKTLTDLVNWVEKLKDTIELSADLI